MADNDKIIEILSDCSAGETDKMKAALELCAQLEYAYPPFEFEFTKYDEKTSVNVKANGKGIGQFSFSDFPSSTKALVSREVYVNPEFRKKGYGSRLNELRRKAAILAGYTILLATVVDKNDAENAILTKNGWKRVTGWESYNGPTSLWERSL
jgi:L-amino acid N-acyltransferase YncA